MATLSAILPVYRKNNPAQVKAALQSILTQTRLPEEVLDFFFRLALAFAISSCTARWMAASSSFRFCCFFFSSFLLCCGCVFFKYLYH